MNIKRRGIISKVAEELIGIKQSIEDVRDEEQSFFDNMPESIQQGDRGQQAEDCVSCLEEVIDFIDQAIDSANRAGV